MTLCCTPVEQAKCSTWQTTRHISTQHNTSKTFITRPLHKQDIYYHTTTQARHLLPRHNTNKTFITTTQGNKTQTTRQLMLNTEKLNTAQTAVFGQNSPLVQNAEWPLKIRSKLHRDRPTKQSETKENSNILYKEEIATRCTKRK